MCACVCMCVCVCVCVCLSVCLSVYLSIYLYCLLELNMLSVCVLARCTLVWVWRQRRGEKTDAALRRDYPTLPYSLSRCTLFPAEGVLLPRPTRSVCTPDHGPAGPGAVAYGGAHGLIRGSARRGLDSAAAGGVGAAVEPLPASGILQSPRDRAVHLGVSGGGGLHRAPAGRRRRPSRQWAGKAVAYLAKACLCVCVTM